MRSFVWGQCHVEYYFAGEKKIVTYPWSKGPKGEEIEAYYDEEKFSDWKHAETGAGAGEPQLAKARALQRRAQFRADFINAENSMGFHAPQEAARILAEAIDYARQGQLALK